MPNGRNRGTHGPTRAATIYFRARYTTMVFLIGVDHLIQYNGPVPEPLRQEFKRYLADSARELGITLVAEEFSSEALNEVYHAASDTAREAALMLGIPHRFCDPEERDMRRLGIPYFAELLDRVQECRGIAGTFIPDDHLRKTVRQEAAALARSYWPVRESFWYEQIEPDIESRILFICGHEHVSGFRSLLLEKGHACTILDPFWRGEIFRDYANFNLA